MKVLIVYYSLYGHTYQMALAVQKGVASVPGVEAVLRRVEEFEGVIKATSDSSHVSDLRKQTEKIPVCSLDDLREADGVLFGSPTRYGNMTAQLKQLIDSTASLWLEGEMEGKPAGVFTSTAFHSRGAGNNPLKHDDSASPPWDADRGSPLFPSRHDSHRGTRRRALWRNNNFGGRR